MFHTIRNYCGDICQLLRKSSLLWQPHQLCQHTLSLLYLYLLASSDQQRRIWAVLLIILVSRRPLTIQISNGFQQIASNWNEPGSLNGNSFQWPQILSGGISVVPVHSHNDYSRRVPLFDALAAGCTGVEADISLQDGDLLVGHTEASLRVNRTLRSLYLDPLSRILQQQNLGVPPGMKPSGIFTSSPSSALALLIDMKTDGSSIWPVLLQQLEPLRQKGWLTTYNGTDLLLGPITIVGTGNTPFSLVLDNGAVNSTDAAHDDPGRFIFFDAPLDNLASIYNASNSYYASAPLGRAVGRTWLGKLSRQQLQTVSEQTQLAAHNGLQARYWDTPAWPISWRDQVWSDLVGHGVGMLNADDVVAASRWNWNWCVVLGVNFC